MMNEKGLTLIELMVAVILVGILSFIGMQNYQHYVAVSRQLEVKTTLSAMYITEKAFQQQFGSYSGCLTPLGGSNPIYNPTSSANNYYTSGLVFPGANCPGPGNNGACGPSGLATCQCIKWKSPYTSGNGGCIIGSGCSIQDLVWTAAQQYSASATVPYNGNTYVPQSALPLQSSLACMTKSTFTLGAAGYISSSSTVLDMWTIDQNQVITNTQSGL